MIDIVELIDKYVRSGMIAVEERGPVKHPNSFRGLAVGLIAAGIFCTVLVAAHASLPGVPYLLPDLLTSIAAAPGGGFWLQIQDDYDQSTPTPPGYTVAYDGAPSYGNVHHAGLIAAFPGTNGYWIVTRDGKIHARGGAPSICRNDNLSTCSGYNPNPTNYLTAIAPTPTGKGLWAVGRDGTVWSAGDAVSYGDTTFDDAVPTGIAATPSGKGYYISVDNGGVHCFGDAAFYGSTGGNKPNGHPISGIATSIDSTGQVNGYWLVSRDGGVLPFGSAPFWGSSGGNDDAVTSIVSFRSSQSGNNNPETVGYAWINKQGRVGMCTRERPCGGLQAAPAP
jgi:hypothetical protein